jgi:hypothetical protein
MLLGHHDYCGEEAGAKYASMICVLIRLRSDSFLVSIMSLQSLFVLFKIGRVPSFLMKYELDISRNSCQVACGIMDFKRFWTAWRVMGLVAFSSELEGPDRRGNLERETGIEPATNGLGSRYSTIELLPLHLGLYLRSGDLSLSEQYIRVHPAGFR